MDMIELVQLVSRGAIVLEHRAGGDDLIDWARVRLGDGRQLLLMERSYRPGLHLMFEPTDEELDAARRDAWTAWSSDRSKILDGLEFGTDWTGARERPVNG
jgi:hypothetical protein